MLEVTAKVWEIMQSVLKEEKERLQWKGFAEKEGFKLDVCRKSIVILM